MAKSGYVSGSGSSGYTYKFGVHAAAERTCPAIFLFENVLGVLERPKDDNGRRLEPAVEAWGLSQQKNKSICFQMFRYVSLFYVFHHARRSAVRIYLRPWSLDFENL